ncbi:SDR family oxidoreductase [Ottowia sp. SB7-C50]|uniref:SDR family NAD(P)-dependent oxidoreductase n=1 Tax=Ottowia sp. SB7-C50 TaxID=3081231 RepID=UPI002954B340|nr:SDR family oxidoreductase [Ottowia sp. SB7-C50]WOP16773.1 SDR family oxidoreductase [Ottowia sp. SB7-C50]
MRTDARHAVVTGTTSGIGRAIAASLLDAGWRVTGLDLAKPTLTHAAFDSWTVNLASPTEVDQVVAQLREVDALVHAAGVLRVGRLQDLGADDGALMWQVHVDAATRLCKALVPAMAARADGRVVFIGSRVAQGMPGRGQYAATKAAVIALARSWAAEVAPNGVTLNVVSPAATATGMLKDPARAASAPRLPPIGRLIEPAEIAQLVHFLLSPAAAAITGQDIAICGGASLPH